MNVGQTAETKPKTKTPMGGKNTTYQDPETLLNELSEMEIQRAIKNKSTTAVDLASSTPPPHRKEMEKLFLIGLYVHKKFEKFHKIPTQDISGAIALFLYGIWSINNNGSRISSKAFPLLIASTKEVFNNWGAFLKEYNKSPPGKRKALYETFAMIGNWLLIIQHHLDKQTDDDLLNNVKIMVREIITRSLNIEPEYIQINQLGRLTIIR